MTTLPAATRANSHWPSKKRSRVASANAPAPAASSPVVHQATAGTAGSSGASAMWRITSCSMGMSTTEKARKWMVSSTDSGAKSTAPRTWPARI